MHYTLNSKLASLLLAFLFGFGMLATAEAEQRVHHINASVRAGPDSGWDIRYDSSAYLFVGVFDYFNSANQKIIPMWINFPIENPALAHSFRFEQRPAQTSAVNDFGLRTSYMYFTIENRSNYNITGLHFILSDINAVASNSAPPIHPGYAHFHLGTPVPTLSAPNRGYIALNAAGTEMKVYTHIRDATLLGSNQTLHITGTEAFGIHQYEVQGQNRSFQLLIIPDYVSP